MPSSAKSPQQMFGSIAKSYYAENGSQAQRHCRGLDYAVPAKKYEAARPEFADGVKDVDFVLDP